MRELVLIKHITVELIVSTSRNMNVTFLVENNEHIGHWPYKIVSFLLQFAKLIDIMEKILSNNAEYVIIFPSVIFTKEKHQKL